jgi:hypothetical protein
LKKSQMFVPSHGFMVGKKFSEVFSRHGRQFS